MSRKRYTFCVSAFLLLMLCNHAAAQDFSGKKIILKPVDYELNVMVDYEQKKMFAICHLTALNSSDSRVNIVPLILYRLMKITSIKDTNGNVLEYEQRILPYEDWEQYHVNFISLNPGKPLLPEEQRTFMIEYEGYLHGLTETGMRYVRDTIDETFTIIRKDCRAYPEIGYPSWKINREAGLPYFDYEVNVTVPQRYVVANGGELTGKNQKNGKVTWSYRNILPAWRIDIAVADYGILRDEENKLKLFYFKKDKEGALRVLEAMKKAMALYSEWFGPLYNNRDFSVLEIPEGYGSQTDVTCILQTADAFNDPEKLYALYHELAHRWSVMETDPLPSRFEAEGSATFLQYLATEVLENKKNALEKGLEYSINRFRKQCDNNPKCKDVSIVDYGKEGMTGLSYSKGMIFFYVLYELVGRECFNDIIGSFYRENYKKGATSEEFISLIRKKSPKDLDKFLEEWLYGSRSSQYLLDGMSVEEIVGIYR